MQPSNFPASPLALIPIAFNHGNLSPEGFQLSRVWLLASLIFSQGGAGDRMDLSKVGEKFLTSVRSARSISLLSSTPDRPEVIEKFTVLIFYTFNTF